MICLDIQKLENLELKKEYVSDVLNNIQTFDTDPEAKAFIESFKNTNESGLSLEEKLIIIEEAAASAPSNDLKLKLLDFKQEVKATVRYYDLRIVKGRNLVPEKVPAGEKDTFFNMNFGSTNRLIPILGNEQNAFIVKQLHAKFFYITKLRKTGGKPVKITSQLDLARSMHDYRMSLLWELYNWVGGFTTVNVDMYAADVDDNAFNEAYKVVMRQAWQKINHKLSEQGSSVLKPHLDSRSISDVINPITAFYLLLNFDLAVEFFSRNTVNVLPVYKGTTNNFLDKYIRRTQDNPPGSFEDVYDDIDGDKVTSKLLVWFLQTITADNGKPLTSETLNRIVAEIHYLLENGSDSIKNTLMFIVYGDKAENAARSESSEIARIKDLIKYLNNFETVHNRKVSIGECKALASALNEYMEAHWNAATDSIKDSADLSDENLGQLFLQCLQKSVMTYGMVNEDRVTEQKSMLTHNKTKAGIWGALQGALKDSLKLGLLYMYKDGFQIYPGTTWDTFDDILSPRAQLVFLQITGISLQVGSLLLKLMESPHNLEILGKFLRHYRLQVMLEFGYPMSNVEIDAKVGRFIERLKQSQEFIEFSDMLVEDDSSATIKILDGNNNAVPIIGTHTTISHYKRDLEEFRSLFGAISAQPSNNTLLRFPELTRRSGFINDNGQNQGHQQSHGFISHIVFATDAAVGTTDKTGKLRIIKTLDLSVAELAAIGIGSDYLSSIVRTGTMLTQIEAYSDKVRIAKGAWNLASANSKTGKRFLESGIKALETYNYEQHVSYYSAVELKICQDWGAIFNTNFENIQEVWLYFEDNTITEDGLRKALLEYQRYHPDSNINILREVHYSIYDGGDRIGINPILYQQIINANNPDLYQAHLDSGYSKFLLNVKNFDPAQISKILTEDSIEKLTDDEKLRIINLFFEISEDGNQAYNPITKKWYKLSSTEDVNKLIKTAADAINEVSPDENNVSKWLDNVTERPKNQILDFFLHKYFLMNALFREADLQVMLKHAWCHDKVHSGNAKKRLSDFNALFTSAKAALSADVIDKLPQEVKKLSKKDEYKKQEAIRQLQLEQYNKALEPLRAEFQVRLSKSKKRFNAGPASFAPFEIGNKYGVPRQMKIAHVEHARLMVFNYFGNNDELNSHDGAIMSTGITRRLERHSASNRKVSSTLKTIMLQPEFAGFMQIKCADFEMSNAWIRWTLKNNSKYIEDFNGIEIFYKMLSPAKLTMEFVENWKSKLRELGHNFYYDFAGRRALLTNIEQYWDVVDQTAKFKFEWTYLDNNEVVPADIVIGSLFDTTKTIDTDGFIAIDNLFDLWQAFGGAYCLSQQSDGTIAYSDASLEVLADLMSEYDEVGSMKSGMIHKLIDEEASKSSQGIKNAKSTLLTRYDKAGNLIPARSLENDWVVQWFDANRYGIQQDYGHQADGSTIPMLTQVVTAVAFNGENSELVQQMYRILGQVVEESLQPFIDKWEKDNDHSEFHKYMGKSLLRSLETNSVASNAEEIIRDLYNRMHEWNRQKGGVIKTIPYSDPQVFFLATSHLISKLNTSTLKQEFQGIAVVQNPANGIVGVYEDVNGILYTQTDITEMANDWIKSMSVEEVRNKFTVINADDGTERLNLTQEAINQAFLNQSADFAALPINSTSDFSHLGVGDIITLTGESYTRYVLKTVIENGTKKSIWVKEVVQIPENQSIEIKIDNPLTFKLLYDEFALGNLLITKLRARPRDLATTKITWQSEIAGDSGNLWLLDSTFALIESQVVKKGKRDITLEKWHQDNLRGLRSEKPYVYFTKEDYVKGIKTYLTQTYLVNGTAPVTVPVTINYLGGEEILPKKYKTALGLNDSMAKIKKDPEYFHKLAERRAKLDPSLQAIFESKDSPYGLDAIYISKEGYDIVLTSTTATSNTDWIYSLGKWRIMDNSGNFIEGIEFIGDEKNPPEYQVELTRLTATSKPTVIFHTLGLAKENLDYFYNGVKEGVYIIYSNNKDSEILSRNSSLYKRLGKDVKKYVDVIAQRMRVAFETSTNTISARIPSQAFQSFLANKTVGYTETDNNDGYMNIWEMWFQGSDYDIDKAYTMMYELDSHSGIAGNIYTRDCLTSKGVAKSLLLPIKNNVKFDSNEDHRVNPLDPNDTLPNLVDVIKEAVNEMSPIGDLSNDNIDLLVETLLLLYPEELREIKRLELVESIVNKLEEGEYYYVPQELRDDETHNFVPTLITYVTSREGMGAHKNRVMQSIYAAASDLRNLKAAEVPMESGEVGREIEKQSAGKTPEYHDLDPFTLWQIQRENAVGKKDVGIAANSIKAAGALQQHFNLLKDDVKKSQKSKISVDLKFNIKDRVTKKVRVIKDSFTRLANTKVSREVFGQQLKGFPANELSLVEGVSPIEIAANNNQQVLKTHRHGAAYAKFWENYYRIAAAYGIGPDANIAIIQEKLLDSDATLESILQAAGNATIAELGLNRSKDIRFVLVLKSYAETYINQISEDDISYKNARMLDGTNGSQFIDVLYYGLEFEPNVADTLSIFISLATDNAKELKLSKMYGRPELLSLPLAMITLGMDIDEVIDICINLLGPISDELDKSRYEGHVKTDVREIIGNLVDRNVLDKETADSLYKIYDTAQELRALTSFFKVNQGVTAKYSELVLFLQGLSKLKIEASKHAKNLDKEQYPEIEKAIDFDRLFTDSDYQKQLLGEYEATKSCFNVLEIVLGSPHFSQLLRSIQTTTKLIEDSTGKGRIMKELNLSEMFDDKLNKESELKFQNRVLRLVDSYVIEQALHNMSDVSFTAGDLREKFPHFRLDLKKDVIVGLQNSHQIEHFLHFVDKILIPQLKAEYPNNFFFANLTVKEDRQTGLSYWDIPFDPFDAKQSLFTAENLNMAAVAFEEIAPHNLGVRTVSGKDMTIGDIMYLYTLITSRNLIRGSMTCVYQAIKDTSPYLKEVSRQYQIIDKLAQNASMQTESSDKKLLILNELLKNQSAQEISNIVETLRPYVKALRKEDGRDKFTRGTEGNEVVENYSVKEFFLPTLSKGTTHGTFTIDDSNIPNTSKYLANIFVKRAAASLHMSESEFNGVYNPIVRLEKVGNSNSYQLMILMQYSQGENGKVIQLEPYRYTFTPEEGSMPYSVLDSFFDFVTANTSGLTLILSSKGYSGEFKESSIITDETEKENLRENLNLENSLDNDIFNYCTKQSHRWVKTRKGSSRLINIGNNKENPVRIPMVNADEFSIIDAARLYFLSTHGVMSENQLMVALVNSFLAEDAQISDIYQVYEVLNDSEFIDKVKSSKAALVLIDYLKNQEATESIKRLANIALTKYLRALSYRDIYYRTDSNMSKLKEGDIFEFDGTEYMYVALTEFGSYVLRKITQLNNPNVPDVLVKIELDLQNEGKKKLSLQILSNLIINDFNHTSYSYNQSTPEPLNIKNKAIQIGDRISNGFNDFYVKDIIYVETSNDKLELKYVVYDIDLDASNLTLKSESEFTTGNWTHQTPDVRISLYNAGAAGDQLLISHFSDELKRWVLQQANPASITIMVNNEYLSISRVNHNNVVTVEGSLIPFSSIQGITISSFSSLNDPRFEMRSHAARIETKYWDEDLSIYLAMPEFKRGFVETERKSDSKYQIYVAAVTDGNGDIQYSLQPGDSDYLGLVGDDTSDVLTGDILYDYKQNILYKVANKQLGIYYKMSRTKASNPLKVNGKDVLTTARREIVQLNDALLKELSLFRVAGSNSVRKVARFKNNSNTASDTCDHLLSYLADKFNTTVELVNDPNDTSFAKVVDGRIIINMANKPNNVSDSNYILEQGIHEFTHLVLAYLQANYPSLYIELLDKVEQIEGISDEVYKYDVTKREEALVRLITQNLAKNNQWMDSTDGKAAYDALIRAFKYLFDDDTLIPDNSDGFLERSIQSAISVFSDNWRTDIISLLMQRVTDELFNQIRKC